MIPLPKKPKVSEKKGNKAVFEIEGLYPGYGVTVGNTLRRVLFSSLEGAAITQVKIKGAPHEFSTLPGVLEDVLMILLNLKKLRFKLFTDIPQTIILNVKGEKEVLGKDFKLTSEVELSSPDKHIATLTKSTAELNIEGKVEKGVGYEQVEMREVGKQEVGVLQIDAMFSPVTKVNFSVENMRVGKRTDFDLLKLEVETDGTVSPEQTFADASKILLDHFSLFKQTFAEEAEKEKPAKEKTKKQKASAKAKKKTVQKKTTGRKSKNK